MSDDRRADGADDREERPQDGADSSVAPQPASAAARRERRADATRPAGRADRTRAAATAKARPARNGAAHLPTRLIRFLREVIAELRKVIWPTRKELVTYTGVVLFFVVVMVAFVWLLDLGFQRVVLYVFG